MEKLHTRTMPIANNWFRRVPFSAKQIGEMSELRWATWDCSRSREGISHAKYLLTFSLSDLNSLFAPSLSRYLARTPFVFSWDYDFLLEVSFWRAGPLFCAALASTFQWDELRDGPVFLKILFAIFTPAGEHLACNWAPCFGLPSPRLMTAQLHTIAPRAHRRTCAPPFFSAQSAPSSSLGTLVAHWNLPIQTQTHSHTTITAFFCLHSARNCTNPSRASVRMYCRFFHLNTSNTLQQKKGHLLGANCTNIARNNEFSFILPTTSKLSGKQV